MRRLMFAVSTALLLATAVHAQTAQPAGAILLDFSSAHCPPCQAMKPILAQIEQLGTPVRHVDVSLEPHMATRYGIRKTPTFIVVSGGKEITRLVGTQSFDELRAALATNPSGPLTQTRSKSIAGQQSQGIPAPQTRLAPIAGTPSTGASSNGTPTSAAPQNRQTLVTTADSAPRSEAMPSVSLADAVERARAATVRLRVYDGQGYGAGTGTIIDTHGQEALVLTCGHLFRDTEGKGKIEVDLYAGGEVRTVTGQVIDYDADTRDIALVAIRPGFAVQPVGLVGTEKLVRNGQTAFSYGCDRGDDPSRRDTRITGVNKYNQHLGVSNLEISGAPIDGRSGGGLFDENGLLIGVCNAADYKEDVGIYAGPGSIHWQLDRVGLNHLYKSASETDAGTQPPERIASLSETPASLGPAAIQPSAISQPSDANTSVQPAAFVAPAKLGAPAALGASTGASALSSGSVGQEVIVIVRDKRNPESTKVMTVEQPSAELMRVLQQHAQ